MKSRHLKILWKMWVLGTHMTSCAKCYALTNVCATAAVLEATEVAGDAPP